MKAAFWILLAVTFAVYAVMVGWSLPLLAGAAGGLQPFDLRLTGYSFADAQAFITALGAADIALYQGTQHLLDFFYPPLMALTLFFAIASLARPIGKWRWLLAALALPAAPFDWMENHAVSLMLDAGADGLTPALVANASLWTQLKGAGTSVGLTILLILLIWRAVVRLRHRRNRAVP